MAGPISPLGIGGAKYILVAVDVYTRFLHVMPMRTKAQIKSLLAQLFVRVRVQVIPKQNNGERKLHTDKGVEFMSRDLESCLARKRAHVFRHSCTSVKRCSRAQDWPADKRHVCCAAASLTTCGWKQQYTLHMPRTCFLLKRCRIENQVPQAKSASTLPLRKWHVLHLKFDDASRTCCTMMMSLMIRFVTSSAANASLWCPSGCLSS